MRIRARVEIGFERWGHWVTRHHWWTILASLLFAAAMISQLPQLTLDTSSESFLYKDDPIRVAYDEFRRQFGRDELISIGFEPPEIFDLEFLTRLRAIHEDLEAQVPHVDEVTSLINARVTRGEGDRLIVEDLFEVWPETAEEVAVLRERALANPLYRNLLISDDGHFTAVLIETTAFGDEPLDELTFEEGDAKEVAEPVFLTGEQNDAVVAAVESVLAAHADPSIRVHLAGSPVLTSSINLIMKNDVSLFLMLSLATMTLLLYAFLRTWAGVFLPLVVVTLSMLCTISAMAIAGVPFQMATQILPTFLLAVGIGNSVHLLAVFYQRIDAGVEKEEAIAGSLAHSGLPIAFTSLTTAGGLGSFMAADMYPVAMLGAFSVVGIMLALVSTIVLLPALLAAIPVRPRRTRPTGSSPLDKLLRSLGELAVAHPWKIVIASMTLVFIAGLAAAQLSFAHDPVAWYPESHVLRKSIETIDERLKGTISLEVLFDTGEEDGLYDPEKLSALDALAREIEQVTVGPVYVGKTSSLVDVSKEIHQALSGGDEDFYRLPTSRELIAQELLLFENSGTDDLEQIVDTGFQVTRMTVKVPWVDAIDLGLFMAELDPIVARFEEETGAQVEFSGLMALVGRTVDVLIFSLADSYALALCVITPLMMIMLGSVRRGLVSMIPNLTPIILTLGLMKLIGVPMDAFTLLIGGTALGLAVDDTIHFMHNFGRYYSESGDAEYAVFETLRTTGRAMLFTTLVLTSGFLIYTLSEMAHLFNYGLLTAFALGVAFLADTLLAPALMVLLVRYVYARK